MKLVLSRLQRPADNGASLQGGKLPDVHQRTDIPLRADVGKLPSCKTHKYTLYGKQAGKCVGRQHHFPLVNFTIDLIVPKPNGGTDHLDNLQLLCNACNSSKEAIDQAAIFAELKAQGSRD